MLEKQNKIGTLMVSIFSDHNSNKLSAKRIVVFILIALLTTVIIGHVFYGKIIAEYIYNGLVEAVIWSMGFIGSEKFVEMIPQVMNKRRPSNPVTKSNLPSDSDGDSI